MGQTRSGIDFPATEDLLYKKPRRRVTKIEMHTLWGARVVVWIEEDVVGIGRTTVRSNDSAGPQPHMIHENKV